MRATTLLCAGLIGLGAVQAGTAAYIPAKAVLAQVLLERAFDRGVESRTAVKPWSWADMSTVARVSIPRLHLRSVVLDSGSGQAMAFGPTLLPGTAAPGANGTSVIAAHRDTHFRNLGQVKAGDEILVEAIDGTATRYRVEGTEVVRWNSFGISADRSTARLALVTCYPFGANTHGPLRFVVHAAKVA